MRLGVSYSVFDGEELLESSIKSIRDNVDHISVMYQTTSWRNNPAKEDLVDTLSDLLKKNLVDSLVDVTTHFPPCPQDWIEANEGPKFYEIFKRNLGLMHSEFAGCTHFMSMDADEYYKEADFKYMKETIEDNDIDGAVCPIVNYFKDPTFQMTPRKKNYFVSTIYKVDDFRRFGMKHNCPVAVDPTRIMPSQKWHIFDSLEVEMHHMSWIRKDILMKFKNSSANESVNSTKLDEFAKAFKKYKVGEMIPGWKDEEDDPTYVRDDSETTKKVENIFNVPKF